MSLRVFWDSIYELCQESVHREGVDPNSMEGVRDLNHIGVEATANLAGHPTTELTQAARDLTNAAAMTDLFLRLLEVETGTNSIESQALSLARERNMKERKGNLNLNRDTARDPEVVVDLLEVRLKYVCQASRGSCEESLPLSAGCGGEGSRRLADLQTDCEGSEKGGADFVGHFSEKEFGESSSLDSEAQN